MLDSFKAFYNGWWWICLSAGPWLSKYNFLGLGSIEFKVIGVGPLFDMLDLGFAGILITSRDYKVCVVSILAMTLCNL